MIREAKRPLTGNYRVRSEPDIRYGDHVDGIPAVTVDLKGANESRTFASPRELEDFGWELIRAAGWLYEKAGK